MKTLTLLMLFGAAIACCAQELLPSRHRLPEGGISHVQAANKAKSLLEGLDYEPGALSNYKVILQKKPGKGDGREWRVHTGLAIIKVDALSSAVTMYQNQKRRDDRYRNRGRTGEKFTTSEAVAKAHIRALATKLGVPTNVKQATFKMVGDGVGQDSNPLGNFGSVFKNGAGQIVATLACDLQDGVILTYTRSRKE